MTTGRKPKPTALRLLAGNPGKRPVNAQEPDTGAADLTPPAELTVAARKHWRRLAPMLALSGVLKQSDRDVLALYCEGYAQHVANVHAGTFNATLSGQLRQLLGELGMTPSARARIVADVPVDPAAGKARFFSVK